MTSDAMISIQDVKLFANMQALVKYAVKNNISFDQIETPSKFGIEEYEGVPLTQVKDGPSHPEHIYLKCKAQSVAVFDKEPKRLTGIIIERINTDQILEDLTEDMSKAIEASGNQAIATFRAFAGFMCSQINELKAKIEEKENKDICQVKFKKLHPDAIVPTKAYEADSGYDLAAIEDFIVPAKQHVLVPIGLAIQVPKGYYYDIRPRSGLHRKGITAALGLIDSLYCGALFGMLINLTNEDYKVTKGDRIAQLVFSSRETNWTEVDKFDLKEGTRAEKGWGSSGS